MAPEESKAEQTHIVRMKEYTSYKMSLKPSVITEAQKSFSAKGIRAVKMDDIARNLGISKRTLYELYSNKEDVLIEVIKRLHEERKNHILQFREECDDVMDLLIEVLSLQLEAATNTCSEFYRDLQRYPRAEEVLMQHYETERLSAEGFFSRGVEEGYFIPYVDYSVMQKITTGTIKMIRTNSEYSGMTFQKLFINYLYPTIRGFCTAKGVEKIDEFARTKFLA